MLDEKDLAAIAQLLAQQKTEIMQEIRGEMDARFDGLRGEMDARFDGLRGEMDARFDGLRGEMDTRFAQQKTDIMHEVGLLTEGYFDPKFNHLADALELLKEQCVGREEVDGFSDRLDVVEAVIKVHSREIEKLKKANHIA